MTNKKIYFASDFHLGVPTYEKSLEREKRVVAWLDYIKHDAESIYLVGDIFDFWYEYKSVVPKGFIRLLGKLAELSDSGIALHLFTGNHDVWMNDYFERELNAKVYKNPITITLQGKTVFVGHGDGLGPGDHHYKFLKRIFTSRTCQWLFSRLHPNLAFAIAQQSSKKSRLATGKNDEKFLGNENEWLYVFCRDHLKTNAVDYFVFGHRHLPLSIDVEGKAKYINLGEWFNYNTYAEMDSGKLELKEWK
jgi:UDP-2,3-diacylglucosamine hydrolase